MANSIFSRSSSGDESRLPAGSFRVVPTVLLVIVVIVLLFSTAYTVETGNVAVKKTLGTVDLDEVTAGFHMRLPFVTQVREFSAKENAFDLTDLTPKAADNLSLRELDVTVF